MNLFKINSILLIFNFLIIFVGCNSESGTKNVTVVSDTTKLASQLNKSKKIIYSLPSPVEISTLLMDFPDQKFYSQMLNPYQKATEYNSNKSMAINLGIYIADLSYANLYEQSQITVNYVTVSKKIAEKLGILSAFDEPTIKKLNENINNREVIIKTITEAFMKSDAYLQENGRQTVAVMIIAGGIMEGLYLASTLNTKNGQCSPEMIQYFVDQKYTIQMMLELLSENKTDTDVASLIEDFKQLDAVFNTVSLEKGKADSKDLKPVFDKIISIRNAWVKS